MSCFYDHRRVRLGRYLSKQDSRNLVLSNYTRTSGLVFPAECRWDLIKPALNWGMAGNDSYGNCVIATAAHIIDSDESNEFKIDTTISDKAVISLSKEMDALDGYNILDRLKYWRKFSMWDRSLWAFAMLRGLDDSLVKYSIFHFGSLDVGVNLPNAWRNTDVWDTGIGRSFNPGSWGGHSVPLLGYDNSFLYACTWGVIVPMTWPAFHMYCDERYVTLLPSWIAKERISPSGVDLIALHNDLATIGLP
jgi:hypothetical protein